LKRVLHVLRGIAGIVVLFLLIAGIQSATRAAHLPHVPEALVIIAAGFAIYATWVRLIERRAVRELSLRGAASETGIGLGGGIAIFTIVIALIAATGAYRVQGESGVAVVLAPLLTWFAGAVLEELAFRGFLFRTIREAAGTPIALLVSAVFFGLAHAANPGATVFTSFAIAIEAGVLLAIAYLVTERLWLPIGIHTGWNFAEGTIFGTGVSGNAVNASLVHGALKGSALITGGSFGPEASVAAIVVCACASGALYLLAVKRTSRAEASTA
jgi:membrane protease YdiL (CAAX protease family)